MKRSAGASTNTARKRIRRSDEQLIRDLEAKIRALKERSSARQLQKSPSMKLTTGALRTIDKAAEAASAEGNTELWHALAEARQPLADCLERQGMSVPKTRRPRGPRSSAP